LAPAAYANTNLFPNAFASFLLGAPSATGSTYFTTTPTARQTWWAGWLGDTVNLFHIVTLDLGVRYDVFSPITPRHAGGAQTFNPVTNTLSFLGANSVNAQDYDLNNIAPRVGVAVRITPKTAFRAGWGMHYFQNPIMLSGYSPATYGFYQGVANGFTAVPGYTNATFPGLNAIPAAPTNNLAPNGPLNLLLNGERVTPYVHQFNAQLQQELVDGIVLGIGYQGVLGRDLPYSYEFNQGLPGTGLAGLPLAAIARTASTMAFDYGLTSNYNALQVNLTKRMAHGLQFQAAYTWSRALGYTNENGFLLNPFDRGANYGPADYQRKHMLTIAHVWDLPFGTGTNHMNHGIVGQILGNWAINGVFTWATGTPVNVYVDPLLYGGPNGTLLANLAGTPYTGVSGLNTPFLNAAAFAAPAPGTFGTLSRNTIISQGFRNYNVSLFKTFAFLEHYKLEFRGEAYNLTNSPHFVDLNTSLNSGSFGTFTGVGDGLSALGRQIDVAIRVIF
jgi:hypothetical protein